MTSGGKGKTVMKWIADALPSLLFVSGVVMVAYSDLSQAQKDIEDLEENDKQQTESIKKVESMATDIENIKDDVNATAAAILRIETAINKQAVEDAKYHHKHLGGNGGR